MVTVLLTVFCLAVVLPARADAQEKFDHQTITGPLETGEAVTAVCLKCHDSQAHDLMQTSHWKWKGLPKTIQGLESSETELGKRNLMNNFCISIEGGPKSENQEKCSKCHPSYGWVDNTFDFTDKTKIDCLICHAKDGNYNKYFGGYPDPRLLKIKKMDLLKAARSVGRPGLDQCGTCHFKGGSGDCVKHGDLDTTLLTADKALDVHMNPDNGLVCVDCHKTEKHAISGASIFMATHSGRVNCSDCHDEPHADSPLKFRLNQHLARVACQTCHIPDFARNQATQVDWDWSQAGQDTDPGEMFDREDYHKMHGKLVWAKNVIPTYEWYTGKTIRYMKGDVITAGSDPVYLARPAGSMSDPTAKIFPFKVHTGKQPLDSKFRYLLIPHTHGGYWEHYDWKKALTDGAIGSGLPFSGEFEFVKTAEYSGVHHMVNPRQRALKCIDCHLDGNRLDWKKLGYAGDPMVTGTEKNKENDGGTK